MRTRGTSERRPPKAETLLARAPVTGSGGDGLGLGARAVSRKRRQSTVSQRVIFCMQGDVLLAVDDVAVDGESLKRVGELIAGPVRTPAAAARAPPNKYLRARRARPRATQQSPGARADAVRIPAPRTARLSDGEVLCCAFKIRRNTMLCTEDLFPPALSAGRHLK